VNWDVGKDDLGGTGCANESLNESVLDLRKRWSVAPLRNVGQGTEAVGIDVDFSHPCSCQRFTERRG